jgi:vacuolar-type H+-ATPase subunit E/Vma4
MERTVEKLGKFSEMVMQDAYRKKKERVRQAETEKQEIIASSEIQHLQKAYEKIQDAVRRFEKQYNEEISKAVVESKEAMFNRRDEIIGSVFANVKKRLEEFVREKDYPVWIEKALGSALREAGEGKISVTVDEEDLELFKEIRTRLGADFDISESDEPVIGGFLILNRDKGLIWNYTFVNRLNRERASFLERIPLNID